jgi:dTMP kinase
MGSGLFITFEGGEGAGKSTQIRRLQDHLTALNLPVLITREPGGTPEAEKIRDFLVQREGGNWSPREECLLLYAARAGHVERLIKPALAAGTIVLCDRFSDSTLAYQGYGHGLDTDFIRDLDTLVLNGFKPDLTFILDIDPAVGLTRSEKRLASTADKHQSTEDRFERLDFSFHKRLRKGYAAIAKAEPDRCVLLDAELALEDLTTIMTQKVKAHLGKH